jgi:dienelactone hydrolase
VSGAGFVAETTKLHKLYVRMEPQLAAAKPPEDDGEEALGTFLPRGLVTDLSRIDLLETGRRPARRTLVIDGGNFPGRDALVTRLRELDAAPELRSHPGHKFLITVSHRAVVPDDVIASIVDWLGQAHPKEVAASGARAAAPSPSSSASTSAGGPIGERPLVFGGSHPLFGILTPADPAHSRTTRPAIVLSNAGCVNRAGPHRTYVKMARRWAALGFDVLRVDLSGIGDSPVAPGTQENVPYPPSALDDLAEAIEAVRSACGREKRVIIAGLCSGGDYAFQLGARAPEIAGALLLNPRTFCVLDLAAVESADGGAPPMTPVEEVPRSLRSMAERGVETLLVVSRNDPGVAYVDLHAGDAMRSLSGIPGIPGFRRVDVESADHTFTPISTQKLVSDLLTEHLLARHGG